VTRDFLKLILPNDMSYLEIAQLCVRETARKYGFTERSDLTKIELALEEAISNVIKHAYAGEEDRTFEIICERIPLGIQITLREKGIPFDPSRLPQYKKGDAIEDWATSGLGMFLMKESMDEVSFHNLGMEGKETQLIKYLQGQKVDAGALEPPPEHKSSEPAVITEKIAYDVRRMQPAEAIEVSRCAYKSHGYTFFDDHIYYPDRIVELNNSGQVVSAVAVTKDNVFMGHAALVHPYPQSRIAELTFVFVNVEYRGQGCMSRLCDFLFSPPQSAGLTGIYAYAVTNHIFTQKVMLKHAFNDCGLLLGTSPATWQFKGMEENTQRISVILSYKYLAQPKPMELYPPPHHRDMIAKLYRNIGAEHHYREPADPTAHPAGEASVIDLDINPAENCAELAVKQYGKNVMAELKSILRKLCVRQVAAINLFLNLEDPHTFGLTAEIEKLGFFFAGILPGAACGDALILQYLNNVELDYTKIMAFSEVAKELEAYVQKCDPNAAL